MTAFSVLRDKEWDQARKTAEIFAKTASRQDRALLRSRIVDEVLEPLVEDLRDAGESSDKQSRLASQTVTVLRGRAVPSISAGGGGGLPGALFWGSEFGGRRRKPVRIARISRRNPPFVVRHVTNQFRPHLKTGYWFFPTLRAEMGGIKFGIARIVDDMLIAPIVGVKLKKR